MNIFLCSLLFLSLTTINGYKIFLYVPGITNSQIVFYYALGDLLASHGHDVTLYVVLNNPDVVKSKLVPKSTNITIIKRNANIFADEKEYEMMKEEMEKEVFEETGTLKTIISYMGFFQFFAEACEKQITDKEMIKKLIGERYDIAIGPMYEYCPLALFKILEIPTHIWMSSHALDNMAWHTGVSGPPSFVPNVISSFGDRMSFTERFKNFLGTVISQSIIEFYVMPMYNRMFKKHLGADFPDVLDLAVKAPLIFVNSDEMIDFPRPILHKIIYIGGFDLSKPKPLSQEWIDVMENSKKGVVLFSFGSAINTTVMPEAWKAAFRDAFAQFPDYTFIWKYDAPMPEAADIKNIKLTHWAPQKDLLGHPKLKVFITHCGFNSFLESLSNGVPMLAVPLYIDQLGNYKRAQKNGVALGMEKHEISTEIIVGRLKALLSDKQYSQNAKRLSNLIRNKPVKPEYLAVKWVEFLAEYKELPNLQPVSAEMTLIEYLLIDVIAVLFLGFVVILFLSWMVGRWMIRKCCGKDSEATQKKSKKE